MEEKIKIILIIIDLIIKWINLQIEEIKWIIIDLIIIDIIIEDSIILKEEITLIIENIITIEIDLINEIFKILPGPSD